MNRYQQLICCLLIATFGCNALQKTLPKIVVQQTSPQSYQRLYYNEYGKIFFEEHVSVSGSTYKGCFCTYEYTSSHLCNNSTSCDSPPAAAEKLFKELQETFESQEKNKQAN